MHYAFPFLVFVRISRHPSNSFVNPSTPRHTGPRQSAPSRRPSFPLQPLCRTEVSPGESQNSTGGTKGPSYKPKATLKYTSHVSKAIKTRRITHVNTSLNPHKALKLYINQTLQNSSQAATNCPSPPPILLPCSP
ncbi:hypothetical protein BU23DRAFT_234219 [Bimuria novae-zelandiae CBS 107.79]|uniref:Uncharacterized protein n=1 Tax=Bimuria novae-zelandiae CBS 107.79 TaxID=1447943 RepID=A0A6A5UYV4_9PLEO|nr:hypothetical protein BU23DRAFT_234219 [Bimuria novae-zelandiae CBS 107.79]